MTFKEPISIKIGSIWKLANWIKKINLYNWYLMINKDGFNKIYKNVVKLSFIYGLIKFYSFYI